MPKYRSTPTHIKGRLATAKRRGWLKTLRKKQHDRCYWCQEPLGSDATLEHLQPLSKNGEDSIQNAAAAHRACNADKADMTEQEYRAVLRARKKAS